MTAMNASAQVAEVVLELAAKLGTTSEYLWAVLVRQARVEAMLSVAAIAIMVSLFLASLFMVRWSWKWAHREEHGYEAEAAIVASCIASGVILVVMMVGGFDCLSTAVTGFNNPEYWALNRVLEVLGRIND